MVKKKEVVRGLKEPDEDEPHISDNEQLVSRRLNTMLPADVFYEIESYCKRISLTGMGKWDYGVGLRSLLDKAKLADRLLNVGQPVIPQGETIQEHLEGEKKHSLSFNKGVEEEKELTFGPEEGL